MMELIEDSPTTTSSNSPPDATATTSPPPAFGDPPPPIVHKSRHHQHLRELGDEATWTLSSAKSGNGAEQLRDGSKQTFWQSDGTHPHTITIQFHRRVSLSEVGLYLDFKLDESYTPKKVRVLWGSTRFDLQPFKECDFHEPSGWVSISLLDSQNKPLRAFCLQIALISMHQNGRDTHVRLVRLFGSTSTAAAAAPSSSSSSSAFPLTLLSTLR